MGSARLNRPVLYLALVIFITLLLPGELALARNEAQNEIRNEARNEAQYGSQNGVAGEVANRGWLDGTKEEIPSHADRGRSIITKEIPEKTSEEIIITAERAQTDLREYAGAVSALDGEALISIAAVHPAESLNTLAGVHIHRGSGQEHLTSIRSPVLTGGAGAGSFLYLEDGVPLRAAGFANVNGLFEGGSELVTRIEVTKGPGSVLYGSNAVHGLINMLSDPPAAQYAGRATAKLNNDGLVSGQISLTGSALGGRNRISLFAVGDNGFRAQSGYDQQKLQILHHRDIGAWGAQFSFNLQNLNQETAGFVEGDNAFEDRRLSRQNAFPEAFRDSRTARLALRLDRDLKEGRLTLIPYARYIDLAFLRHFVPGQAREENGHRSIGLLGSFSGQYKLLGRDIDFILGGDIDLTEGFLDEFQDNPTRFSFVTGAHYDYEVESLSLSAFGQARIELGHQTGLTIGLRADYTAYNYDNRIESGAFGRFLRIDDRSDDYTFVTPKIGLVHQFSDTLSLYGRLARGARAPQVSDAYSLQINQIAGEIEAETLDAIEAGIRFFGETWSWQIDAFYMEKENFFFRNAAGFNVTDGETDHRGVELAVTGPLSETLVLDANVTFAAHRYVFNDPSSGIIAGSDVDTAPRVIANATATWTPLSVPDEALSLALHWQHIGRYYTDPANTRDYPGHDVVTLRGDYRLSDTLSVFGRIDNLTDTNYANRADFAFGNERFFPGRPRTFFAGIRSVF